MEVSEGLPVAWDTFSTVFTSRDAQCKARYSDRARPSVCLFVCLSDFETR